jgi:rubrerythrin
MKKYYWTTRPSANGTPGLKRKEFIQLVGGFAVVTATLSNCDDDNDNNSSAGGINLGSGDTGILNYAYTLEQLETYFYENVVSNAAFTSIFSTKEQALLSEIRENELVHREFYRTALGSDAIQDLEADFSSIDFTNKASILTTAHTFEDTGVAAYNGAAQLLTDANILAVSGKIVSIEARHAAILRNMLAPKTPAFAGDDVVNPRGLDLAMMPFEVLPKVQAYLKTKVNGDNLPNA